MSVYDAHVQVPDPKEGYALVLARPRAIEGRVIDTHKTPIRGAQVRLVPRGTITHPEGGFVSRDPLRAKLGIAMPTSLLHEWKAQSDETGAFRFANAPVSGTLKTDPAAR